MLREAVVALVLASTAGCASTSTHRHAVPSGTATCEAYRGVVRGNHCYRAPVERRGSRWFALASSERAETEIDWVDGAELARIRDLPERRPVVVTFEVLSVLLAHDPASIENEISFYDEVATCHLIDEPTTPTEPTIGRGAR